MKKLHIAICVLTTLGAAAALAASLGGAGSPPGPEPKLTGGPDSYGYRFVDNRNPDTASYRWVDTTSGSWVRVAGLGDDNAVGPFNIGFNFPYYWYRVSQFWIHANGGISFSLPARAWTPQNTGDNGFPNTNLPNDLIGALGIDLDFTNAGVCKYRARTTAPESLIISWIGVRQWNTTNTFTFQLVLAKADSTIRAQIQTVTNPPTTCSMGIENMGGNVGLSYYNNGTPNQGAPVNGRAIKYYPPATSTYTVTDAGVVSVMNPQTGAVVKHTGDAFQPTAIIKNFGTTNLTGLKAVCRIRNSANAVVYADSLVNQSVAKGGQLAVTFNSSYNPSTTGTYRMVVRSYVTENPVNTLNDSLVLEIPVVTYPSWIAYDDNARDGWMSSPWTGFANYFEVSRFPVAIDSVQAYVNTTAGTLQLTLYDTTGNMGGPGAAILDTTITNITANGWYKVGLASKNITVNNGKFYVGFRTPTTALQFGMDQTAPFSRRTWEYTGSWTPYRSMETQDAMIRVNCHSAALAACYVDSAAGNDANAGSSAAPLRTIGAALGKVAAGVTDTVYIRNGTYAEQVNLLPAHSGTAAKRHVISAQAGQGPKLKPSGKAYSLSDSAGNCVTINGLAIYPGTQQLTAVIFNGNNVTFSNNTVYSPTMGPALLVMNQTNSVVKGNTVQPVSDNAYPAEGIWLYAANNNRVDSNRVTAMIDAGILVGSSSQVTVCRNVVDHCYLGIDANGSANDSIYNNTIDLCTNSGIHIESFSGSFVTRNNNITNGYFGFCWVDSQGTISSDYNNVWNNTYNYKNPKFPGDTNVVTKGAHDISANPQYTGTYHIQTTSPCRNAGINVGLPFLGAAPDIGAYEDWSKIDLDAGPGATGRQSTLELGISRPNPFHGRATIDYQVPAAGMASLKVYNIAGQLVRTLVNQAQDPGRYIVTWDGEDERGRLVSSGVYYYRLAAGGRQQTRSLLYVK